MGQQPEDEWRCGIYIPALVTHRLRSAPGVCDFSVTFDIPQWPEWPFFFFFEKTLKQRAADAGSWKSASRHWSGKALGTRAENHQHLLQIALLSNWVLKVLLVLGLTKPRTTHSDSSYMLRNAACMGNSKKFIKLMRIGVREGSKRWS